ncbi:MAG: type II toxin-antitoxin system VapC family toxin [bacterium]|nr:type II toxin-antitoxin system VapC family toxin [bacterium]
MKLKKPLVIDSSVAVKWLNKHDENYTIQADKILKDVQNEKVYLVMPELAKYEVGNALLYKQMPLQNVLGSLATYYSIPIQFMPQDQRQAQSAIQIAYENKVTFYDASFMALAKEQQADLITDNPKHQKKKINGLSVIPLKDY